MFFDILLPLDKTSSPQIESMWLFTDVKEFVNGITVDVFIGLTSKRWKTLISFWTVK